MLQSWGCSLYTGAAYTRVFTVVNIRFEASLMISFVGSDPTSALFVIQGVTFNLIRRVKKKEMARGVGTIVQGRRFIEGHLLF